MESWRKKGRGEKKNFDRPKKTGQDEGVERNFKDIATVILLQISTSVPVIVLVDVHGLQRRL